MDRVYPVMPTTGSSARWQAPVGIHDFVACTKASRGWRAFARHDELPRARVNRFATRYHIHESTGVALFVIVALHLAGATYHGVTRRDGVVRRMI
jgi:cytochrome b561